LDIHQLLIADFFYESEMGIFVMCVCVSVVPGSPTYTKSILPTH